MSIEKLLGDLITATQEQTKSNLDLITQLKVTASFQERLVAGQAAAIEKVEAPKATRKRAADKAAETPTPTPEPTPAPAEETAEVAKAAPTSDELREIAAGYLSMDQDAAKITERRNFIGSLLQHFGSPKIAGDESTLDDEQRKQSAFFILRKKGGLSVDFGADYDFDGDPVAAEASGGDDFLG